MFSSLFLTKISFYVICLSKIGLRIRCIYLWMNRDCGCLYEIRMYERNVHWLLEKSIWRIVARESGALTPLRISWRITSYRQAIVDMYVYMFFRFLLKDRKDSSSFLCWLEKLYQWRFFVSDEEENYYRGWNVLLLLHNFPFPLLF